MQEVVKWLNLTNDWFHLMITNDSSTGSSATSASLYNNGNFMIILKFGSPLKECGMWEDGINTCNRSALRINR